ncbi:MAG: thioredoxin family protein [Longimicrobiales bacterium]
MMRIEVLGPGCRRCHTLEENVRAAVGEMGVEAEIVMISDIREIAARGVLMTPGLVVDGKTVASGHLLSVNQVKKVLEGRETAG